MKVIVAGGYGCGTTHVYRMACELMQAVGLTHERRGASQDVIDAEGLLDRPGRIVIKTHDAKLPPRAHQRLFLCRRDRFDAAASHLRRADSSAVLRGVAARLALEQFYAARRDVTVIDYEVFYRRDHDKLQVVAERLGLALPPAIARHVLKLTGIARAREISEALTEDADHVTELRRDHIGPTAGAPGAGAGLPATFARLLRKMT